MEAIDAKSVGASSFNVFPSNAQVDALDVLDKLDLFYGILGISLVVRGRVRYETVAYASVIYDEILATVKSAIPSYSTSIIDAPLLDALEVADCMGPEDLRSALQWAFETLLGLDSQIDPGVLEAYAQCIDWDIDPNNYPTDIVAGGVVASFTGSLNKYISRVAVQV